MTKNTPKAAVVAANIMLFDNRFDPIEGRVRTRGRGFIETMLKEELTVNRRAKLSFRNSAPIGSLTSPLDRITSGRSQTRHRISSHATAASFDFDNMDNK